MAEWLINHAEELPGITRMRARFQGFSFSPHRHDTYAVGITTHGVQAFDYRGVSQGSGNGFGFVLHPDERHDGRAGTEAGFGYSIAYVSPDLIHNALNGTALPFLRDPVSSDRRLVSAIHELLTVDAEEAEAGPVCAVSAFAFALQAACGDRGKRRPRLDLVALRRAETALREPSGRRVAAAELERHVGMSRWELARQFRLHFGVSLARFNLLRRLEQAQRMLQAGSSIVEVALACGFTDQAHLTRAFKQAHGLTPGKWISFTKEPMVSRNS